MRAWINLLLLAAALFLGQIWAAEAEDLLAGFEDDQGMDIGLDMDVSSSESYEIEDVGRRSDEDVASHNEREIVDVPNQVQPDASPGLHEEPTVILPPAINTEPLIVSPVETRSIPAVDLPVGASQPEPVVRQGPRAQVAESPRVNAPTEVQAQSPRRSSTAQEAARQSPLVQPAETNISAQETIRQSPRVQTVEASRRTFSSQEAARPSPRTQPADVLISVPVTVLEATIAPGTVESAVEIASSRCIPRARRRVPEQVQQEEEEDEEESEGEDKYEAIVWKAPIHGASFSSHSDSWEEEDSDEEFFAIVNARKPGSQILPGEPVHVYPRREADERDGRRVKSSLYDSRRVDHRNSKRTALAPAVNDSQIERVGSSYSSHYSSYDSRSGSSDDSYESGEYDSDGRSRRRHRDNYQRRSHNRHGIYERIYRTKPRHPTYISRADGHKKK